MHLRTLSEHAIENEQLAIIADAAGDARVAIGILRNAARRADQANTDQITTDIDHEAVPDGRHEVRQKTIDQLNDHQRALYEILDEEGKLNPGNLTSCIRSALTTQRRIALSETTCRKWSTIGWLSPRERIALAPIDSADRFFRKDWKSPCLAYVPSQRYVDS
ncbi:hypothetical protein [Haladaptatus halobius]|uniref:hypothetical protein n=1 Tax=Haladaptatus halobius TaxID=2884875 RepID=UPI003F5DA311